jgi:NAD(P)-dependent dehydrogenase (short-subunit alcohol dehydrogenase family)
LIIIINTDLSVKVAIATRESRGIGKAISLALALCKASVIVLA